MRKLVVWVLVAIATMGWLLVFLLGSWPLNLLLGLGLTAASYLSLAYALRLMWPDPKPHSACPNCDYNLTGNTSGICPECGTLIQRDT